MGMLGAEMGMEMETKWLGMGVRMGTVGGGFIIIMRVRKTHTRGWR